jgi:2-polyprenyl-3-methyl-5-hydroxy-6-metoxy-1,4-benzoquinol methylase
MSTEQAWFASWFDTNYYHILYKNRDDSEASYFIENLFHKLKLSNETVLDLACGKGRHSIFLNSLGLNVLGVDLSENSISLASTSLKVNLDFKVHDMREVIKDKTFDVVFNLFTSFGYFDNDEDNHAVLKSVHQMLHPNGRLVIDFMNAHKVVNSLVKTETKTIDGIQFDIKRNYDGKFITKDILVIDQDKTFDYQEKVRAFFKDDFIDLLHQNGFVIKEVYGDFSLNNFDQNTSDRLIIVASKK